MELVGGVNMLKKPNALGSESPECMDLSQTAHWYVLQ